MPTVIMVHGAFCGGWAFERFREPFEAQNWTVLAPDLPGRDKAGSAAGRSISDYVTSIADLCATLPERPVLLGHSMGGLVCQLAARRTNAAAVALLAPSAPWGVHGSSMEEAATAFGVQLADPASFDVALENNEANNVPRLTRTSELRYRPSHQRPSPSPRNPAPAPPRRRAPRPPAPAPARAAPALAPAAGALAMARAVTATTAPAPTRARCSARSTRADVDFPAILRSTYDRRAVINNIYPVNI